MLTIFKGIGMRHKRVATFKKCCLPWKMLYEFYMLIFPNNFYKILLFGILVGIAVIAKEF